MFEEDNLSGIAIQHAQVNRFFHSAHNDARKASSAAYIENPKRRALRKNLENSKGIKEMKDGNVSRILYSGQIYTETPFPQKFHVPHHFGNCLISDRNFKETAALPDNLLRVRALGE